MPYFEYQSHRIHYVEQGAGTPLVLLPGNTASSGVQGAEVRFFGEGFRVICPDYLGYGRSDRVDAFPLDFWWANAEMTAALMRHLGLRDCLVMGASGGAVTGLNLAIQAPELVRCVVADSFPGEALSVEAVETFVAEREHPAPETVSFYRSAHGDDWEQVVAQDSRLLLEAARTGTPLCRGRLGEIACPVLLTGSLADAAIPHIERRTAEAMRQIPRSKAVLYPNGGHPLMWTQPGAFRRDALRFFEDFGGAQASPAD